MEEVNIYIHNLNHASLSIARDVRAWQSCKVRLLISATDLKNADRDIQKMVGNWRVKTVEILDPATQIDWSLGYYEWNLSNCKVEYIVSDGLKVIIQRCRTHQCQFVVLGDCPKCKNQLVSFVDAPTQAALPSRWYKYPWLTSFSEIEEYCRRHGVFDFDPVNNRGRFQPTGKTQQGEKIYKDLETGYLIYLDHFHKTRNAHYEVFDQTGMKHLGEMSLNGVLDVTKADRSKCLIL